VLVAAVAAAVLIQTSGVLQQKAQSTGKQATQEVSSNLMIKNIEGVRAKNTTSADISDTIDMLKIKVGLNVGSAPVDVNQVVISVTDGTTTNNLIYGYNSKSYATATDSNGRMDNFNSSSASTNIQYLFFNNTVIDGSSFANPTKYFTAEKIRDEDTSFSQDNPVMNTGDLITVYIGTASDAAVAANYTNVGTYTTYVANETLKSSRLNLVTRTTMNIVLTPEAGAATTADFVTPSSYGVKETVALYP